MLRPATIARSFALLLLALPAALPARPARAFPLRAPQVAFDSQALQPQVAAGYPWVNLATDQVDAQVWDTRLFPNETLNVIVLGSPPGHAIGVYNALEASPQRFEAFPANAGVGWLSVLSFGSGTLRVIRFDQQFVYLGQTTYTGVDEHHFGFYMEAAQGVLYSQDARNGGAPQALTYDPYGSCGPPCILHPWFECFEGAAYSPSSTFTTAVLLLQTDEVLPARPGSWGALKAFYH